MGPSTEQHGRLIELSRRRAELHGSMRAVEHALGAPSQADPCQWAEQVCAALLDLSAHLRVHMAITEGSDGLYGQVARHAPRLVGPTEQLAREHIALTHQLEQSLRAVDGSDGPLDRDLVRRLGTQLLGTLSHHRRRGADMVHEAFDYDVGGEE